MPLSKAKGNMYEGWVTHCHTHLRGACPHACHYCYVKHGPGGRMGAYAGPLRLEEKELKVKYGSGKKIFVEHCTDLFAVGVSDEWIKRVLRHCYEWPDNQYIFQSKNPGRLTNFEWHMPRGRLLGTTIESNYWFDQMGHAPAPGKRAIVGLDFVTVEPIMRFDNGLFHFLWYMRPKFVNIGADSKGCGLPEPGESQIVELVGQLRAEGIEVRLKSNLERLAPSLFVE